MTPHEALEALREGWLKLAPGDPPIPMDKEQFDALRKRFPTVAYYLMSNRGRRGHDRRVAQLVFSPFKCRKIRRTIPLVRRYLVKQETAQRIGERIGVKRQRIQQLLALGISYLYDVGHLYFVSADGNRPRADRAAAGIANRPLPEDY